MITAAGHPDVAPLNTEGGLDPELVRRLSRTLLQPGVISGAIVRRILGWVRFFEGGLPLLEDLSSARGGGARSPGEELPVVYAEPRPAIVVVVGQPSITTASGGGESEKLVIVKAARDPASGRDGANGLDGTTARDGDPGINGRDGRGERAGIDGARGGDGREGRVGPSGKAGGLGVGGGSGQFNPIDGTPLARPDSEASAARSSDVDLPAIAVRPSLDSLQRSSGVGEPLSPLAPPRIADERPPSTPTSASTYNTTKVIEYITAGEQGRYPASILPSSDPQRPSEHVVSAHVAAPTSTPPQSADLTPLRPAVLPESPEKGSNSDVGDARRIRVKQDVERQGRSIEARQGFIVERGQGSTSPGRGGASSPAAETPSITRAVMPSVSGRPARSEIVARPPLSARSAEPTIVTESRPWHDLEPLTEARGPTTPQRRSQEAPPASSGPAGASYQPSPSAAADRPLPVVAGEPVPSSDVQSRSASSRARAEGREEGERSTRLPVAREMTTGDRRAGEPRLPSVAPERAAGGVSPARAERASMPNLGAFYHEELHARAPTQALGNLPGRSPSAPALLPAYLHGAAQARPTQGAKVITAPSQEPLRASPPPLHAESAPPAAAPVDIDALVSKVQRRLLRSVAAERERKGGLR